MFEYSLAAGLTASGADTYLLHVTTTPSVSHVIRTEDFDCGIMISASHNPYYDNGIKVMNGNGEKLEESVIEEIEKYLDGEMEEIPLAKRENIGRTQDFAAGRNRYIGYLISIATRSFKGKKVGLDCSNGSASSVKAGGDRQELHERIRELSMEAGRNVKEKGLDVGFAYDGDADRCLAVDENGNVVDGDLILYICGKYMKEQGLLRNNKIVTTVMSNLGLYKALDREGIGYEKTAVGDKYVYENMSKTGNCLGGEQSGHIIFSKYATTGDGILTSLKIMEVMLEKKETLGKLASEVTILPQLLKNVRVADKAAALNDPDVQAAGKAVDEALGNDGRLLLRQSGTEPLIRVMVEAETPEICEKYVDQVIDVLKKKGHVTES